MCCILRPAEVKKDVSEMCQDEIPLAVTPENRLLSRAGVRTTGPRGLSKLASVEICLA